MNEVLERFAARAADHARMAQSAAHAGTAFAIEKRNVDAEHALTYVQGHAKTELINALRSIGQQLRP
ncbi:hypothetical protein [Trinickia acidisoli]|uniref:hypothetical protein n=1 Tax=Trinickia acidisoli TaxID=2767482 RepID=UPI001A8E94F8|nr:hypothetical protein [Trinickia acidisoli]